MTRWRWPPAQKMNIDSITGEAVRNATRRWLDLAEGQIEFANLGCNYR